MSAVQELINIMIPGRNEHANGRCASHVREGISNAFTDIIDINLLTGDGERKKGKSNRIPNP